MNMNKRLKPNLIDSKVTDKISRTINPPKKDYWKPTRNVLYVFYSDYVQPNFYFFLFVVTVLLFLLYRYRIVQDQRAEENFETGTNHVGICTDQFCENKPNYKANSKTDVQLYSDAVLDIYNKSKELSLEPRVRTSKNNDRVEWAPAPGSKSGSKSTSKSPKFAYPMFPFTKGGTLAPIPNR